MAIHATFAKKLARLQNPDDRLLALLRRDGQLDLSVLNVKHGVRGVALRKHLLVLLKFNCLAHAHLVEEVSAITHVGCLTSGSSLHSLPAPFDFSIGFGGCNMAGTVPV